MRKPHELAVERAVALAGGRVSVAELFEVSPEAVRQWSLPGRFIPAENVLKLQEKTGVSCHDMLPKVFGRAA